MTKEEPRPRLGLMVTKNHSRLAAGLALLLVAGLTVMPQAGQASDPPDVVLILIDALRADHLGCYGYGRETSPVIDALSKEAVVLETAMSQASWTKPSVPSLLTGLYPIQHGVFTGSSRDTPDRITSHVLGEEHVTLAEALNARGYTTGAFIENAQIRSFLGFDQGFDLYAEDLGNADNISRRFIEWLDTEPGRPFFAYVHFLDPHWPYTPPRSHQRFPLPEGTTVDFNNVNWKYFERQVKSGEVVLGPADLDAMRSLYDGEIHYTDEAVGRMLDALRQKGLYENTIIVITSDHGEEFMDHGHVGHGNTLYDEVLHVPLIIRAPGMGPGRVSDQVQLVDVMPTIVDLAGIAPPVGVAGRSLRSLMQGESVEPLAAFADHRSEGAAGRILQSIRHGGLKLIRTFRVEGAGPPPIAHHMPEVNAGDWIEIEGVPEDGHFLALEVEPHEPLEEVRISGPVQDVSDDESTLRIIDVACRLSSGTRFKDSDGNRLETYELVDGTWVQIKGLWREDKTFEVSRVKFLDDPDDMKIEVKAPVLSVVESGDESMMIHLKGIRVKVDDETEFEGDWPEREAPSTEQTVASPRPERERKLQSVELYDLLADPGELRDISKDEPDRVRELYSRLDEWEIRFSQETEAPQRVLDQETIERLKSLGYIR